MLTLEELLKQISELLGEDNLFPSASETDIALVEQKLGVRIPEQARTLVRCFNGTRSSLPDHGWIEFWPLERWCRANQLVADAFVPDGVVFCDYSLSSWYYALDIRPDEESAVCVITGVRSRDRYVASSLTDFISKSFRNSADVYPLSVAP